MANKANSINLTSSRFRDFCQTNTANPNRPLDPVYPIQHVPALHQPISDDHLTRLDHTLDDNNIPAADPPDGNTETRLGTMQCCCGRPECAYLEHNNAALGGLERDLETAARLGQALLDRHEAYVKESQAEQTRLSTYITDLENEKSSLQDANQKIVDENRELLQKLEHLNTDFGESGQKVQDLERFLQECEQEIRRLNGLTRKTQELELKMLDMEREQADLNKHIADGKEETRSTISRWKESERRVRELEQEVQRIEWAAKLDREKHEGIVARMERDRALDRELGLSEGRLKATAAVQNLKSGGPREKQVVSNFVRDILQDNANLQAGIAELRELLQSSNDEVQNLREQVILHQPVLEDGRRTPQRTLSLSDELALSRSPPKQVQQELHVHHHYHAKVGSKKEKMPLTRRSSRRRALLPSAMSSSPTTSELSTPLVRAQRYNSDSELPPGVRAKDSRTNRWSMQSTATTSTYMSSIASSPRSYFDRNSCIFDRPDRGEESSRPTSPDSFILSSPMPFRRKTKPEDQALSVFEEEDVNDDVTSSPRNIDVTADVPSIETGGGDGDTPHYQDDDDVIPDLELTPRPSMYNGTKVILEQQELALSSPDIPELPLPPEERTDSVEHTNDEIPAGTSKATAEASPLQDEEPPNPTPSYYQIPEIRPSIRRRNSHDSLMSISGMDIHLAQHTDTRSALALLRGGSANKHYFAPCPSSTRKVSATQPLASVTEYTAISRPGVDNTSSASMVALSGIRNADNTKATTQSKGLIGSVGGWVRGKWGVAPTRSIADLRSAAAAATPSKVYIPPPSSTQHRPSASSTATSSAFTKSSAVSERSIATTSTSNSRSSTDKRSVSANLLDIPKQIPSISISPRTREDSSNVLASSFFAGRKPGINQSGPIPGFAAAVALKRVPTEIEATKVDVGGLKESLGEQHG